MSAVVFRLNNKFWLDRDVSQVLEQYNTDPTFEDILQQYQDDFPNGVLRLLQEDVLPTPEAPVMSAQLRRKEFLLVILFSEMHGPFFTYDYLPILNVAPDIAGSLDNDQRLAIRHWQFPYDEDDTSFRVFYRVSRGTYKVKSI